MQHHITYYNISCIIRLLIVFEWKLSQLVKIASSERERILVPGLTGYCDQELGGRVHDQNVQKMNVI